MLGNYSCLIQIQMKKDIYIEEMIMELVFSSDGITLPYCKILEKHGSNQQFGYKYAKSKTWMSVNHKKVDLTFYQICHLQVLNACT